MPRKSLDVRMECVRLNAKGKPKPTEFRSVGCSARPYLPTQRTPARLTSSGTWNK